MIEASETWKIVEEKLLELQDLVDKNWDHGDWQIALTGQSIIKTVKESRDKAAELRNQTNDLLRRLNNV